MKRKIFAFLILIFGGCLLLTACDKTAPSSINEEQRLAVEECLTNALEMKGITFETESAASEISGNSVVVKYSLDNCDLDGEEVEIVLQDVGDGVQTDFDALIAAKSLPVFSLSYTFDFNANILIYTATLVE